MHVPTLGNIQEEYNSEGSDESDYEAQDREPVGPAVHKRNSLNSRTSNKSKGSVMASISSAKSLLRTITSKVTAQTTLLDPDLCRGASSCQALRHGGIIFRNSEGSAYTWELSKPVGSIDAFISHNWLVARWRKFLALALHFNMKAACVSTVWSLCVIVCLAANGLMPICDIVTGRVGIFGTIVNTAVFLIIVFTWHEVQPYLRLDGKTVFLDKVCIHQTDEKKKRNGINSLGAFIKCSHTMIIIYSDVYLTKLWTVYELATYLILCPGMPVYVWPSLLPITIIGILIFVCIAAVSFNIIRAFTFSQAGDEAGFYDTIVIVVLILATSIGFAVKLRRWQRHLANVMVKIENFDVRQTICAVEKDRTKVFKNIALFIKACKLVPVDATQEEALMAFNRVSRERIPLMMKSFTGIAGLPYEVCFMSALILQTGDLEWAGELLGEGEYKKCCAKMCAVTCAVLTFPLLFVLMNRMSKRYVHLSGFREALYVSLIIFVIGTLYAIVDTTTWTLQDMTIESGDMFFLQLFELVCLVIITLAAFRRLCCQRRENHDLDDAMNINAMDVRMEDLVSRPSLNSIHSNFSNRSRQEQPSCKGNGEQFSSWGSLQEGALSQTIDGALSQTVSFAKEDEAWSNPMSSPPMSPPPEKSIHRFDEEQSTEIDLDICENSTQIAQVSSEFEIPIGSFSL